MGGRREGSKLSNADLPAWSEHEANALVQGYPPGAVVNVFYDPDKPGEAVLMTDLPPTLWRIIVPSLAFMLVGISILLRTGRS